MIERFERNGNKTVLVDLSDRISNETKDFEPNSHHIDYKRRYECLHAGLTASATEWLIGIDAWGLDCPFDITVKEAKEGKLQFWESHLVGRRKEYYQIRKTLKS
ncbi:hypothetical protein [Bacillus atrophaeus]|nr:hypothetical protein [Bacillus atrophaeus]MCY8818831.1 cyclase family protein [Bacillus atrophaeus]MEC0804740.1 hypothetical protein [Bacillus atrophaeus]MEC0852657.1 hypothetical protein [Bacillus atrophaeus]MEC0946339.1 hypothetical protein [Bacillus atrophaeus]